MLFIHICLNSVSSDSMDPAFYVRSSQIFIFKTSTWMGYVLQLTLGIVNIYTSEVFEFRFMDLGVSLDKRCIVYFEEFYFKSLDF